MTEQRYSDGTLAKWYYSRSNTICDGINEYSLLTKEKFEDINFEKILGTNDLLDDLNRLSDKNIQLQLDNKRLLSDYTDVCNENVALEKKNKQLKEQLTSILKLINKIENCTYDIKMIGE